MKLQSNIEAANSRPNNGQPGGCPGASCSESSSLDEVLAGNALFFLLDLRPLYDFVNASDAPRNVKDCLRRINFAALSIEAALGTEGYARAKSREEKINADLERFLSQNDKSEATPPEPK